MRPVVLLAAVVLVMGVGCGAEEPVTTSTEDQPPTTALAAPGSEPPDSPLSAVFVDANDPNRLLVSVQCIPVPPPGAPLGVTVAETDATVVLNVEAPVLAPPCNPVRVELRLGEPLAGRQVLDASGRTLAVDSYVPVDRSQLVTAECTDDAARAAVAKDVDGGLRSQLLGCRDGWMAVRTSTDACPASGEAPAPECVGNVHSVYWWDTDGYWTITGFDDCENIRRQYPGPPPEVCELDD